MNAATFGQTIQVVDKSGKVVSTSKHLINVFKEAKSAYRERKAEIVAKRHGSSEKHARRALEACTIDDSETIASSQQLRRHRKRKEGSRSPTSPRSGSERSVASDTVTLYPESNRRFEQDLHTKPLSPRGNELARRHTARDGSISPRSPPPVTRSMSDGNMDIDMSLAYGELPPSLPVARPADDAELKGLVGKVKMILDEANCVQYSVTAIIASLQKNPDAMAAVALTLAEISNIAAKMAPGALMAMKGSAPAVFALLASPQFLVAAGVGVGVTIVAFGGYKIIKKIKARNAQESPVVEEMLEVGGDVDRIENWRRGIECAEEESIETSVEGEFITPQAAALSRLNLQEERVRESKREGRGMEAAKGAKSAKSKSKGTSSSKASGGTKEKRKEKGSEERKVKKPSPLRLMFS